MIKSEIQSKGEKHDKFTVQHDHFKILRLIKGEYQMKNGFTDLDSGLIVLLQNYLGKTAI